MATCKMLLAGTEQLESPSYRSVLVTLQRAPGSPTLPCQLSRSEPRQVVVALLVASISKRPSIQESPSGFEEILFRHSRAQRNRRRPTYPNERTWNDQGRASLDDPGNRLDR